jgi:chemotaxis protein MotB
MAAGGGGAWKVAYADFVTAMMAFFLVMWLLGYDEETRQAIQDYFTGDLKRQSQRTQGEGRTPETLPFIVPPDRVTGQQLLEQEQLMQAARKVVETFQNSPEMSDDAVRFEFLADGIKITVIDRAQRPLFVAGTAELTPFGEWVLKSIAWQIDRFPLSVEVEGHVQRGMEGGANAFLLSSNRAEAARSLLQANGIASERFYRVIGAADRHPLDPENPTSEDNRRIAILVRIRDPGDIDRLKEALSRR